VGCGGVRPSCPSSHVFQLTQKATPLFHHDNDFCVATLFHHDSYFCMTSIVDFSFVLVILVSSSSSSFLFFRHGLRRWIVNRDGSANSSDYVVVMKRRARGGKASPCSVAGFRDSGTCPISHPSASSLQPYLQGTGTLTNIRSSVEIEADDFLKVTYTIKISVLRGNLETTTKNLKLLKTIVTFRSSLERESK
jgi:hypothetical protein